MKQAAAAQEPTAGRVTLPPGFVPLCLPTKAPQPPTGDAWLHEIKHDGLRRMARRDLPVRAKTRAGPLSAEELVENAAAIGPEHQHHTHQRATGHHARRHRQGELFSELRFPSLEQERN